MSKSADQDRQIQNEREPWEVAEARRKRETEDAVEAIMNGCGSDECSGLSRFINRAGEAEYKMLAEWITQREHRTLQQKTMSFVLVLIRTWAELPENRYDGRNAVTVDKCKQIVKFLGDYGTNELPCI